MIVKTVVNFKTYERHLKFSCTCRALNGKFKMAGQMRKDDVSRTGTRHIPKVRARGKKFRENGPLIFFVSLVPLYPVCHSTAAVVHRWMAKHRPLVTVWIFPQCHFLVRAKGLKWTQQACGETRLEICWGGKYAKRRDWPINTFHLLILSRWPVPQSIQSDRPFLQSSELGLLTPSSAGECAPLSPLVQGGGRKRGWGGPNFDEGTEIVVF